MQPAKVRVGFNETPSPSISCGTYNYYSRLTAYYIPDLISVTPQSRKPKGENYLGKGESIYMSFKNSAYIQHSFASAAGDGK